METSLFLAHDISVHTNLEVTVQEIHNLAYFYHWGYEECWRMPCRERGVFNDRIIKQIKFENRSSKG